MTKETPKGVLPKGSTVGEKRVGESGRVMEHLKQDSLHWRGKFFHLEQRMKNLVAEMEKDKRSALHAQLVEFEDVLKKEVKRAREEEQGKLKEIISELVIGFVKTAVGVGLLKKLETARQSGFVEGQRKMAKKIELFFNEKIDQIYQDKYQDLAEDGEPMDFDDIKKELNRFLGGEKK